MSEEAFNDAIRHLRSLQHKIDDTAKQAAIELNKLRSDYNHWFGQYAPFLKEYALEHAKVNKDGVKAKHYKSIAAGGGVYFRAIPSKLDIDEEDLKDLYKQPILNKFIEEKIAYKVLDTDALYSEATKAGYDLSKCWIEGDPLGRMYVGTDKVWTQRPAKALIGKALEGSLPEEEEDGSDTSD